jgi:hypothetical protein
MSRLKEGLDKYLPEIVGTGHLIQVQFSLYQIILVFERMSLELFQRCEVRCPDDEAWVWNLEQISDMRGFGKLLQSEISAYEVLRPDTVILSFGNRCQLVLRDDRSGLEVFVIHAGKTSIVV